MLRQGGLVGHGPSTSRTPAGAWSSLEPFKSSGELQPDFDAAPVDVAFAVWDGSKQERDGIKSVSTFTQLTITPDDPPRRAVAASEDWPAYSPSNPMLIVSYGFIGLLVIGTLFLWRYMRREEIGHDGASTP
jgi:hypothetical protein